MDFERMLIEQFDIERQRMGVEDEPGAAQRGYDDAQRKEELRDRLVCHFRNPRTAELGTSLSKLFAPPLGQPRMIGNTELSVRLEIISLWPQIRIARRLLLAESGRQIHSRIVQTRQTICIILGSCFSWSACKPQRQFNCRLNRDLAGIASSGYIARMTKRPKQ